MCRMQHPRGFRGGRLWTQISHPGVFTHQITVSLRLEASYFRLSIEQNLILPQRNWTGPMCTDSVPMRKIWKENLQSSHHHQHMMMGKHCGKASSAWPSPWWSLWGKVLLFKSVLFGLGSYSDKKGEVNHSKISSSNCIKKHWRQKGWKDAIHWLLYIGNTTLIMSTQFPQVDPLLM